MATFDVSIKPNHVEVQNALAQVKKEIANRFDFKGTCAEVTSSENEIICIGENEFQINQITEIIFTKFGKRGVDTRILNPGDMNKSANDKIKRIIDIANGISTDDAKKIVKAIKTAKTLGMITVSFVGFSGGKARDESDYSIHIPNENYGVVEDTHHSLMHILAQYVRIKSLTDEDDLGNVVF